MHAELHEPTTLRELQAVATALDQRMGRDLRCEHVARFVAAIGARLGYEPEHLERLIVAGKLHDIGFCEVPAEIIDKPGPLTGDEMERVRCHPVVAERMIAAAGLEDVAGWVRHHHERWDGEGYPDGIGGPEIPVESRVLAVATALEAMTSERPHRTAMGAQMAARELAAAAGTQFDPGIARIAIDLLRKDALAITAGDPDVCLHVDDAPRRPDLGAAEYERVNAMLSGQGD